MRTTREQPTMVARCSLWQRDGDGPWQTCGHAPAQLDPEGHHLCPRHFAKFWECWGCQQIAEAVDDLHWDPYTDASWCNACWERGDAFLEDA